MTELVIDRLGHRGDGVVLQPDGKSLFVPYALAGETVDVDLQGGTARLNRVVVPSPDRIEAACRHFGTCGGCMLQHVAPAPYGDFKRRLVIDALADRGLTPEVGETRLVPAQSRRRATFAGIMAGRHPFVGFNERASHRLVSLDECPVMKPDILAALPALTALTGLIAPRKGGLDLTVTLTTGGLDVSVAGIAARDVDRLRLPFIELAARFDLARLSAGGEAIVERRAATINIDGIMVTLPPGGFLQASEEAEAIMGELVTAAVPAKAKRVADLYSGVGTFALRLARHAEVLALEGEAGAVAALDRAARSMTGRHRISAERRDLARRPLIDKELEKIDAIVFDPPRAGAAEQSQWLSRSKVPTIVAVSCNPATLARDLRTLVDGGYRIDTVTPVDQFLWSSHVEVVAALRR
ncbi:23S rRNA (uracil(1939)-C(5))-methyltransferase RlmD [Pleomorphomonas sp. T1.2MG-36]|uniref:class I SAM-dependent RNA methyltransferase n=1 Tax=Pleomorphomonas sp. T1.2MG-36 TaxID=3041167 RepID=UPI0024776B3B|nr:class I SAM-dependent RNA methyltransferase [Pleomorphomonas sp. T1.2MG-36]CAI9407466.1 23S rRNA (uracil(1939)-C(5))-methyltransferase RlmD [Pleomorphomonas sp. T1.2MG-36]